MIGDTLWGSGVGLRRDMDGRGEGTRGRGFKATVGKVSLELWPLLTWSLGCTTDLSPSLPPSISIARLAITCNPESGSVGNSGSPDQLLVTAALSERLHTPPACRKFQQHRNPESGSVGNSGSLDQLSAKKGLLNPSMLNCGFKPQCQASCTCYSHDICY